MSHTHDRSVIRQIDSNMALSQFLNYDSSTLEQALKSDNQNRTLRPADCMQAVRLIWTKLTQSLRLLQFPHNPVTRLLIACAIFLSACETTIEIDPPDYDPELNVTSNFMPDSVWAARVTRTIPIGSLGDTAPVFLDNATVMIYNDNVLVARLIHDGGEDGWYESPQMRRPRTNTLYRMVVEAPGLPSASAISIAPHPPRILTAEATKLDSFDPFRGPQYLVSFSLADNPGLNYYSFSIFLALPEDVSPISSEYTVYPVTMTRNSPQWYCFYGDVLNPIASSPAEDEDCTIGILSDRSFDDRIRNFDIVVYLGYDLGDELDTDLVLYVMALSPEYIEHRSSIEEQDYFDGFGQPANLYTNFEGGRGIFAGYSTHYRILDLAGTE